MFGWPFPPQNSQTLGTVEAVVLPVPFQDLFSFFDPLRGATTHGSDLSQSLHLGLMETTTYSQIWNLPVPGGFWTWIQLRMPKLFLSYFF